MNNISVFEGKKQVFTSMIRKDFTTIYWLERFSVSWCRLPANKMMAKLKLLIITSLIFGCVQPSTKNREYTREISKTTPKVSPKDSIPNYKPFSYFERDTLSYLKYNFKKRKAAYINKKLKFLLKDFELPVVEYTIAPWSTKHPELLQSLGLYFEESNVSYHKFKNYIPPNGLFIKLKKPVTFDAAKKLRQENNDKWVSPVAEFYGEIEIEDIGISNTKD